MVRIAAVLPLISSALACDGTCDSGNDCYHKEWAVPCSMSGSKEACESSGGCYTKDGPSPAPTPSPTPAPTPSGPCEGTCDASNDCYHKEWAVPCSLSGSKEACEASGGCYTKDGPSPGPAPGPSPGPSPSPAGPKVAGGYIMMQRGDGSKVVGLQELQALAEHADSIPVNRLWVAFFDPTLVYEAGSNTFANTGMETGSSKSDLGFAEVKDAIKKLQDGGVEIFLSMGGWNYNCFPALYTRYSIGGYGNHTPNYWKIETFGKGSIDGCTEDNMWCWTCEPESEGTTLDSFSIFPEPQHSASWDAAKKYVESKAGETKPEWHPELAPGSTWTDKNTGNSLKVPGKSKFNDMKRDPYEDFVLMAKDLGVTGVDIDYEEFWHADYFKTGEDKGPWNNTQTVYKYTAIAKDMIDSVDKHAPNLKISTAAGAVGAWEGKWWGGNLKGVWSQAKKMFPDVISRIEINVMTYDLSNNNEFHECPEPKICDLDAQVEYYMKTYRDAGFSANVGYEVGQPAYPDVTHDKAHQVPLDEDKLEKIISKTQPQHPGGFFWELYKPAEGHAPATKVAQTLCKKVLGDASRCDGEIPQISSTITV